MMMINAPVSTQLARIDIVLSSFGFWLYNNGPAMSSSLFLTMPDRFSACRWEQCMQHQEASHHSLFCEVRLQIREQQQVAQTSASATRDNIVAKTAPGDQKPAFLWSEPNGVLTAIAVLWETLYSMIFSLVESSKAFVHVILHNSRS